jgi:hypothetical protein
LLAKISEKNDIIKFCEKYFLFFFKQPPMESNFNPMNQFQTLNNNELLRIRGGRFLTGPGDTVADDIDMPDLTCAPGPGDTVDDDIDMPDLTLSPVVRHRAARMTRLFINL